MPGARPCLKWAGGKTQLLPEIRSHLPPKFSRYFEPFVGGGAVFFDLSPERAHLNDLNAELINAYQQIQQDVGKIIAGLKSFAEKYEAGGEKFYFEVRRTEIDSDTYRAVRLIFLNKTCFNGLYRVNKEGHFNVPHGKWSNGHRPTICDETNLYACAAALQGVKLTSLDFARVADTARRGDFCYFDPPYPPASVTSNFTSYTADGFGGKDHKRLSECCRELRGRGVHVLVSNADLPAVRDLYKRWNMRPIRARRAINSKADRRGSVGELLIWSY
jgi:DNA adenine methylase